MKRTLALALAALAACTVDPVTFTPEDCPAGDPMCAARCGDGTPDTGEVCDDGNRVDGDGCDNNCTRTGCGNAIQTAAEACDDGNAIAGDGCEATCVVTGSGSYAAIADAKLVTSSVESDANTSFGGEPALLTRGSSFGARARSLLAFDLDALPPGTVIRKARLVLHRFEQAGNAFSIEVHDILGPWSEATVTWNTQPAFDAAIATASPFPPGALWRFDVTTLVQRWVNVPSERFGIALVQDPEVEASGGQHAQFHAREGAIAPALEIEVGN